MRVAKWAADTGGQHTAGVYAQPRRLHDPRLVPVKGVPGWNKAAPVTGPTMVDVTEAGRKVRRGLRLWKVAVDVFKADLYRRLWLAREGTDFPVGWVHLPQWAEPEHVQQLVAEQLVTVADRRGFARQEWRKMRPNEQLDMAVYARAALSVMGSDRYGERFWNRFRRDGSQPSPPPIAQVPIEPEPARPADPVTLLQATEPRVTIHRAGSAAPRASRYAR
jgi:phage terminase large subunit GpA-like protein